MKRKGIILLPVLFALVSRAYSQTMTAEAPPSTNAAPAAAAPQSSERAKWNFGFSAYTYVVPDGPTYVQPTITADRDWLHLEARYNYEAQDAASIWAGYNLSGGQDIRWQVTPMLGAVFGHTTGIAPGFRGSVNWWKLELYSEGEWLYDTDDSSASFFYNWSELSIAPVKWLKCGIVTQRTRAYHTDREIQWGFLVGGYFKRVGVTAYVFNPDESKPTVVAALTFAL